MIKYLAFIILPLTLQFTRAQISSDTLYDQSKAIIADLDSIVTPEGIQENFLLDIGGVNQWVFTRGKNKNNPAILMVHGGPASPLTPLAWTFQRPIEEYFTVVNYDQRGSGKTYHDNDTIKLNKSIHIDQYVEDCIEIAELIRKRYNKEKVFLLGHSWGSIVGMKAALRRPDLFYAYIGVGQVIKTLENEKLSFEHGLSKAKENNNQKAIKELMSIAPYPGTAPLTRDRIITARKWAQYYGGLAAYRNEFSFFFKSPLLSPEYNINDVKAIHQGNIFTLEKLLHEFLSVDLTQVTTFPIPVFQFMGKHDYSTPTQPTVEWINKVNAPYKKAVWFHDSSHLLPMEEPGKFLLELVSSVRPLAE